MIRMLKANRFFFALATLWFLSGLALVIAVPHGDEVLFLNRNRTAAADLFFSAWTQMGEPAAYLVSLFILLFVRYRSAMMIPLLGFFVSLLSFLFKEWFHYDRPFLHFSKAGLWHLFDPVVGIQVHGGANSFPSGHAMSAFALFTFVALNLPEKKKAGVLLLLSALLVGVSRIYLLQHFLRDVVFGSALGILLGISFYLTQNTFARQPNHWLDKRLRLKAKKPAA